MSSTAAHDTMFQPHLGGRFFFMLSDHTCRYARDRTIWTALKIKNDSIRRDSGLIANFAPT